MRSCGWGSNLMDLMSFEEEEASAHLFMQREGCVRTLGARTEASPKTNPASTLTYTARKIKSCCLTHLIYDILL